jgi:hypothetical protein
MVVGEQECFSHFLSTTHTVENIVEILDPEICFFLVENDRVFPSGLTIGRVLMIHFEPHLESTRTQSGWQHKRVGNEAQVERVARALNGEKGTDESDGKQCDVEKIEFAHLLKELSLTIETLWWFGKIK